MPFTNAMFNELAERYLESIDRDEIYACKVRHNYPLPMNIRQ